MSGETESSVTFVAGRAVEQTESPESNLETDERDAAKEAVRKAIEEAGQKAAEDSKSDKAKNPYKPAGAKKETKEKPDEGSSTPERGPDGKFLPKAKKEDEEHEEEEFDPDKASVKQLLKAREKVASVKKEASEVKTSIAREKEAFQREQEAFRQAQYQFQLQQQHLRQQAEYLANLRNDPARALREFGHDPEQFIMDLAMDGTPEGAARRKQAELERGLAEIRQWKESQAEQQRQYQLAQQREQVIAYRESQVRSFMDQAFEPEKYPLVSHFYKGKEQALVSYGDHIAQEYRNLSGKEADLADILDYMEDQLAENVNSWYKNSSNNQKPKVKQEIVTQKPKSSGKSLSPSESGERRASKAKDLKDLDADERLEAAKQAVKVALANSKDDD